MRKQIRCDDCVQEKERNGQTGLVWFGLIWFKDGDGEVSDTKAHSTAHEQLQLQTATATTAASRLFDLSRGHLFYLLLDEVEGV